MSKKAKGSGKVDEYLEECKEYAMVPVQRVQAKCNQGSMTIFRGSGNNINLVRAAFAEAARWKGKAIVQSLTTVGGDTRGWETKLYEVPLQRCDGSVVRVLVTGMEENHQPPAKLDVRDGAWMIYVPVKDVKRPSGDMDPLVGIQEAGLFPMPERTKGNLRLLCSQFGTG